VAYSAAGDARSGCSGAAYKRENSGSAAGGDLGCAGRDHGGVLKSLSVNTCSKGCIDGKRG